MKSNSTILILILSFGFIACNSSVKHKNEEAATQETETVQIIEAVQSKIDSPAKFTDIWQRLPLKSTPVRDTTNFDNIKEVKELNLEEIKLLELSKVYPNIEKEGNSYKFLPSYKLKLSDEFYSIVFNVFKGDSELESILIIYDSDHKLSQYSNEEGKLTTNSLVIAYDEIAEGWSRKHAKIEQQFIMVIDVFYGETTQIDTTRFHMNRLGDINQIPTKHTSNIRPNVEILPNHIYTDTIVFESYNDEGDYALLFGKKDEKEVVLLYNMDWGTNEKCNFENGDLVKVNWKMDSIYLAGDGETLDFKERAIAAERVTSENQSAANSSSKNNSFVISCGSGCAMTYSEEKVIKNNEATEVVFKVEMYVKEALTDEFFETYLFSCDDSKKAKQIKLKGTADFNIENQHPELQENLTSYLNQLC